MAETFHAIRLMIRIIALIGGILVIARALEHDGMEPRDRAVIVVGLAMIGFVALT